MCGRDFTTFVIMDCVCSLLLQVMDEADRILNMDFEQEVCIN